MRPFQGCFSEAAPIIVPAMAKAVTIAGDRGSALRDNEESQKAARQYRADVKDAANACFLR